MKATLQELYGNRMDLLKMAMTLMLKLSWRHVACLNYISKAQARTHACMHVRTHTDLRTV